MATCKYSEFCSFWRYCAEEPADIAACESANDEVNTDVVEVEVDADYDRTWPEGELPELVARRTYVVIDPLGEYWCQRHDCSAYECGCAWPIA